ncbi:uncharacterized protein LOC123682216 [Harmonia axyridis]|uniref:uncharacterized protein LOC123682216 n=1 Tax=Harmonia axyridis TaxID=115357 RepID=UPI001E2782B3|nr:uncharacterized protein LOC123682216 [Harmonia axyridis]
MFDKKCLFLVVLVAFISLVVTAPSGGAFCFGQRCPPTTTGCMKHRESTKDLKSLEVTILCWRNKEILENHTSLIPNPFESFWADTESDATFTIGKDGKLIPKLVSDNNSN